MSLNKMKLVSGYASIQYYNVTTPNKQIEFRLILRNDLSGQTQTLQGTLI